MTTESQKTVRPAGYGQLIGRYALEVVPNWHISFVAVSGTHRTEMARTSVTDICPASYWPGDSLGDRLE